MVLQVETNVKLEECLKKVQQENEDYKARMDKHAALSKYVLLLLCLDDLNVTRHEGLSCLLKSTVF